MIQYKITEDPRVLVPADNNSPGKVGLKVVFTTENGTVSKPQYIEIESVDGDEIAKQLSAIACDYSTRIGKFSSGEIKNSARIKVGKAVEVNGQEKEESPLEQSPIETTKSK